jgi:hypothetical protein
MDRVFFEGKLEYAERKHRLKNTANQWEGSTRPTTHRGQNAALHYAEVIKGADWSPSPLPTTTTAIVARELH